jgi:type 1 glutamine amidotransferase
MNDAGEGSDVLLTTVHPESMKTIAWTRQYKNARVFCYQSGHDNQAYANPNFRKVVARGIHWLAGRT